MSDGGLDAHIVVALGTFRIDLSLRASPGEVVVVVGPNGAGKTTALRAVAGLRPLDDGHVTLDGKVLDDARGTWVPPHRRDLGWVPQGDHLLPHLTAIENVAFGPRRRGTPARRARDEARDWLDRVGLAEVADSRPHQLSGGQARRLALARALAVRPRVLMLDEPLAALDAAARRHIRRELRRYLDAHDGVRLLVMHDPVDALALADRIVVLEDGRVAQDVTPDELRLRPRSRYVAELVGVNLFAGRVRSGRVITAEGAEIVAAEDLREDEPVLVLIHPRAVSLHLEPQSGSPRNTWSGTVGDLDDEGTRVRVRIDGTLPLVAEITPGSVAQLGIRRGVAIHATVKATEVDVYPA